MQVAGPDADELTIYPFISIERVDFTVPLKTVCGLLKVRLEPVVAPIKVQLTLA